MVCPHCYICSCKTFIEKKITCVHIHVVGIQKDEHEEQFSTNEIPDLEGDWLLNSYINSPISNDGCSQITPEYAQVR